MTENRSTSASRADRVNNMATDIAVIKNEMAHLSESNDRILNKLDEMAYLPIRDFEDFKDQIRDNYVPRHELKQMLKWWDFATSSIGKLLIMAIIALAISGAVGTFTNVNPPIDVSKK